MTKLSTAILGGLALSVVALPACACGSPAITQLADAYQEFFASNGKSSNAKEAEAVASKKLNSICRGAAS
jgi:hypothetical protein